MRAARIIAVHDSYHLFCLGIGMLASFERYAYQIVCAD
jgi:hypothetical protein